MLLCETICTHYPSPLSVHNTPPLGLVFMLLCESVCMPLPLPCESVHITPSLWVCAHYPSPRFSVQVALWVCTHYPSHVFGVNVALWVYTLPLYWVWCSCCSESVHNNPPLGLVFMLLWESVCTHYPCTGFGVHVALWVCLYTLTLPWDWCSCCSVSLSVHTTPLLDLVFMLLCESVCTQ
jgi:hypothetical protein